MDLSLEELRNLLTGVSNSSRVDIETSEDHPFEVDANYLIRTVTMIYTGKLVWVGTKELVLEKAAWIAETERWNETVKNCTFKEVEMYPADRKVIIGRGAILDAVIIAKLPTESK